MQNPSRFSLMKRLLFPYSGEQPLSVKQGARVVLAWVLVFSLPLSLLVLILKLLGGSSGQDIMASVMFAFLSGTFFFGALSLWVVVMSNRAAHIRQTWKAQNGRS